MNRFLVRTMSTRGSLSSAAYNPTISSSVAHMTEPRTTSKSHDVAGAVFFAYSLRALAAARGRPLSGASFSTAPLGHAAVMTSPYLSNALFPTSYNSSSVSAGAPFSAHWRESSPRSAPRHVISQTAPEKCSSSGSSTARRP